MVKIRLSRAGAKKNPYYRVVVSDSRSPRDGNFIEQIGTYNPQLSASVIKVCDDRLSHWLKNGAQLTETVDRLLKKNRREAKKAS